MDFKGICNIFGSSLPFDDYTLDLQDAEEQIEKFRSRTRSTVTPENCITESLLQGILSAAKGEFSASEAFFVTALSTAEAFGDARLISRCATYKFLLFAIKAELPISRFHDDTNGDSRKLSDAETGAFDQRIQFLRDKSVVWPSLTELDRLERDVISGLALYPSTLQTAAFPHHPEYHDHLTAMLFESRIPFEPTMVDEAKHLGLRATSRHMRRLNAQYLLAGASEQGIRELEQLYQVCLHNGDLLGAASCQLILGDNRLSLPFTSPVVLNLCLMNRISGQLADWHDSIETRRPLVYDAGADEFYQRASELFAKAGSMRGTAAVTLRRGCVALAEYLNAVFLEKGVPMSGRTPDDCRASAKSQLDYSLDLYQGDGTMVRLVSAHRIILRILVSCPPVVSQQQPAGRERHDLVSDAADIGSWAKANANMAIARLAGLLFLGVGRLLSVAPQNLDAASLCCACARSCFRGAEERILELHAIIQHAKLHQSHGNMDAARSYLDAGQSVLRHAIYNHIDPLIRTTASDDHRRTLTAIRTNMINVVDSAAASIYANNPRANAWNTLLGELLSERDGLSSATSQPPRPPPSIANALLSSFVDLFMTQNNTSVAGTSPGTGYGAITGVDVAEYEGAQASQPAATAAAQADEQPSIARLLGQLLGNVDVISGIRRQFETAIATRKKALIVDNDWEKGQESLRGVLQSLDQPDMVKSTELYSIRAVVLDYLERNDVIRQWLPDAIPTMFGGRLPTASDKFHEAFPNAAPDLQAMSRQLIRQHGERSLALCFVAQHWELGAEVLRKIQQHAPEFLETLHTDRGDSSWVTMVYIAAIEEHSRNFESSFHWLIKALDIVETSRAKLTDLADRREFLDVIHSAELFVGLARLSLHLPASRDPQRFGQLPEHCQWDFHGPTWEDEALLFLEQGRARALLDLFTPEHMSEDFLEWSHKLRSDELKMAAGESPTEAESGDSDLEAYLEKIHSGLQGEIESQSREMMILARLHPPHFAADVRLLYASIPNDAIAVHINPSRDGVLILYISCKGIELARLSSFTDKQMDRQVLQCLKPFRDVKNIHNLPSKEKWQALLKELSDEIIRPAWKLIDRKSHLIFVPSRSLNKFPFSALPVDGEPLFMVKDVSIVPSLSVLQHLVKTARSRPQQDRASMRSSVIYRSPVETKVGGPLNISASAAIEIAHRLGCRPEPALKLTFEAFKDMYETSDVVVICTHGVPHNMSAWKFNIELKRPLQVLDLVRLRSRAALVVFEACVSGVGEASLGNDVLGFTHSVLSSGAGAFLGALWSISDMMSAMLMSFLFRELAEAATAAAAPATSSDAKAPAGTSSLAACLRRAQIRLYQADAPMVKAVLQDFRAACTALDPACIDHSHLKKFLNTLDITITIIEDEDESGSFDYSHPYFCAPFVLVGHGGQTPENFVL